MPITIMIFPDTVGEAALRKARELASFVLEGGSVSVDEFDDPSNWTVVKDRFDTTTEFPIPGDELGSAIHSHIAEIVSRTKVPFREIPVGQFFRVDNCTYVKVPPCRRSDNAKKYNAVLHLGERNDPTSALIADNDYVVPVTITGMKEGKH